MIVSKQRRISTTEKVIWKKFMINLNVTLYSLEELLLKIDFKMMSHKQFLLYNRLESKFGCLQVINLKLQRTLVNHVSL